MGEGSCVAESSSVAEASESVAESSAVMRRGVCAGVRGDVSGLQVSYLRGVYHASVMSERGGAVFDETWKLKSCLFTLYRCCDREIQIARS